MASASEIPPGGEGEIKIKFNTYLKTGKKRKSVWVYTNDPKHPKLWLRLRADILPAFVCSPSLLDFGSLKKDEGASLTTQIGGYASADVKILDVLSENPLVRAELNADKGSLKVTLLPGHKVGSINERLVFLTDHKVLSRVPAITVSARILGSLKVVPQLLDFDPIPAHGSQEKTVVVSMRESGSFKVTGVILKERGLAARIEEIEPGRVFHVVVLARKGFKDARLDILTDSPDQPKIRVHLFGKE